MGSIRVPPTAIAALLHRVLLGDTSLRVASSPWSGGEVYIGRASPLKGHTIAPGESQSAYITRIKKDVTFTTSGKADRWGAGLEKAIEGGDEVKGERGVSIGTIDGVTRVLPTANFKVAEHHGKSVTIQRSAKTLKQLGMGIGGAAALLGV